MGKKLTIKGQRIESEAYHTKDYYVITFEPKENMQLFASINVNTGNVEIGADLSTQNGQYLNTEYFYGSEEDVKSDLSVREINSIIEYLKEKVGYKVEKYLKHNFRKKVYVVTHMWYFGCSCDNRVIGVFCNEKDAFRSAKKAAEREIVESSYDENYIKYIEDRKQGVYKLEYSNGFFDVFEVVETEIK